MKNKRKYRKLVQILSLSLDVQIIHYMEKLHAIITIKKKDEKKKIIEIIKRTNRTKHKGFTDSIHYRRLSTYKRNEKKKKNEHKNFNKNPFTQTPNKPKIINKKKIIQIIQIIFPSKFAPIYAHKAHYYFVSLTSQSWQKRNHSILPLFQHVYIHIPVALAVRRLINS